MFKRIVPSNGRICGKRMLAAVPRKVLVRNYTSTGTNAGGSSWKYAAAPVLLACGAYGYYKYQETGSVVPIESTPSAAPIFKPGDITVLFILGGPGSGKGTQCANLVKEFDFVHLSAGDLLRAEQKRPDSEVGKLIANYIKEGLIVPQEITLKLLENAIKENYSKGNTKFLIDGFPRKMDQALSFESQIAQSSAVLFFDCPVNVMIERILQRGKTSNRADDNVESLKKRFKTFTDTSMPVVEYYDNLGKTVKVSCNQPVEKVYAEVKSVLVDKLNIK